MEGRGRTIGLPDLRAGVKVQIKGLGRRFSGSDDQPIVYLVTSTTHAFGGNGYTTDFTARMEKLMIPINGVVPGLVTKVDEEIPGRIKVHFTALRGDARDRLDPHRHCDGAARAAAPSSCPRSTTRCWSPSIAATSAFPTSIGFLWNGEDEPPGRACAPAARPVGQRPQHLVHRRLREEWQQGGADHRGRPRQHHHDVERQDPHPERLGFSR